MVSHMPVSAGTPLVLSFRHNQNHEMLFMTERYSFKSQALPLVYLSVRLCRLCFSLSANMQNNINRKCQ